MTVHKFPELTWFVFKHIGQRLRVICMLGHTCLAMYAYMNIVERVLLDERTSAAAVGCGSHYVGTTAEVVHFFLGCRLHFFTREKNKLARTSKRATCPAGGGKEVIS